MIAQCWLRRAVCMANSYTGLGVPQCRARARRLPVYRHLL